MKSLSRVLKIAAAAVLVISMLASCGNNTPSATSDETYNYSAPVVTTPAPVVLATNFDSFQFQIFGDIYTLPMKYSDFAAKGWTMRSTPSSETIEADDTTHFYMVKNNVELMCGISNFDVNTKNYTDCYISGVKYEYDVDNVADFYLPSNLKVNEATIAAVEAAYGTLNEKDDYDDTTEVTYYVYDNGDKNYKRTVALEFDKATGLLIEADITNRVTPSDFVASAANTAAFYNYVAPTSLGSNINDTIFSYDNILYKLPCPLSVFLDNGWTVKDFDGNSPETQINGNSKLYMSLCYKDHFCSDNSKFSSYIEVYVYNDTPTANIAKNCLVREVSFDTRKRETVNEFSSMFGFYLPMATKSALESAAATNGINLEYSSQTSGSDLYESYVYSVDYSSIYIKFQYFNGVLENFRIVNKK